jgi:hypothetical protein
MLAEFGCCHVIVGHSERRALHGESDVLVAQKAAAALKHGLVPILCVGETLAEREAGQTEAVVGRQLGAAIALLDKRIDGVVIAYEPSGRSAPARPLRRRGASGAIPSCASRSLRQARRAGRSASSTAAVSRPTTRRSCSPKPTSTAA